MLRLNFFEAGISEPKLPKLFSIHLK